MVDYDYGFKSPMAETPRPLRPAYDTFGASKRPGHGGLDLYSPAESGIVAPADGKVRFSGQGSSQAGWLVEILHPSDDGWYLTRSMHMARKPVAMLGLPISTGDLVGYVGATGNANSPHNHFEIRWTPNKDADRWTMYGSGWGTRYDPAKFGVLDDPENPPDLVEIRIDRPTLRREPPPYVEDQATQELQSLLAIRRFLNLKPGVNYDPVTATFDGALGPSTEQAVMDYQVSKGLTPDGIVGSATWTTLLDYN